MWADRLRRIDWLPVAATHAASVLFVIRIARVLLVPIAVRMPVARRGAAAAATAVVRIVADGHGTVEGLRLAAARMRGTGLHAAGGLLLLLSVRFIARRAAFGDVSVDDSFAVQDGLLGHVGGHDGRLNGEATVGETSRLRD